MKNINSLRTSLVAATLAALGLLGPGLVTATADAQARRSAPVTSVDAPAAPEGVVNIQTATAEELQRLPGVGPSKAAAIIAFRERTAFRRVEDILRVRGIGRATFRRLRPYLSVSGPTTLATDVGAPRARPTSDDAPEDETAAQ